MSASALGLLLFWVGTVAGAYVLGRSDAELDAKDKEILERLDELIELRKMETPQ